MKRNIISIAAVIIVCALSFSCAKEFDTTFEELTQKNHKTGYSFAISATEDSKTILGGDATGLFSQWEEGDELGYMIDDATAGDGASIDLASDPVTFTLAEDSITADSEIYVYYPLYWASENKTFTVTIFHEQAQDASLGFDMDNMPMVAEPIKVTSSMVESYEADKTAPLASVKFANLGSLINFKVFSDDATFQNEKAKSITLSAGDDYIAGTYEIAADKVDFSDATSLNLGDPLEDSELADDVDKKSQTITTTLSAPAAIGTDKASALDVYMVVAPGTYSGTIILETDEALYEYTYSSKEFKRSGLRSFGLNLASATVTRTDKYQVVACTENWEASLENTTGNNAKFTDDGKNIWKAESSYGRTVTGSTATTLYSPILDMTAVSAGSISFQHTGKSNGTAYQSDGEVFYRLKNSGEAWGEWTKITLDNPSSSWEWKTATVSSSVYSGKHIQFKWAYKGTSNKWQIHNFSVIVPAHAITVNGVSNPTVLLSGDHTESSVLTIASNYAWSVKSVSGDTADDGFTYSADVPNNKLTVTAKLDNTSAKRTGIGTIVLTDTGGTDLCTITLDQGVKGAQSALEAPANISITDISIATKKFEGSWTSVANASSYDWVVSTASTAGAIAAANTMASGNTTNTNFTTAALDNTHKPTAGTVYYLYVRAVGDGVSYTTSDYGQGHAILYQHVFTAKPSTGNNTILSTISWNISATNLGSYNSSNYAGVQIGSKSSNGAISLTSTLAWGGQTSTAYYGYGTVKKVNVWANLGGTSVTPSVTIGGTSATGTGSVSKNSSAGSNWTTTSKVVFTPGKNAQSQIVNTGTVVISLSSVKAGYICAIEVLSE